MPPERTAPENVLGNDPRPRFFPVADPDRLGLRPPPLRYGMALRTWARSLAGMQKEALVVSSAGGRAWRLVSDEGPYLNGYDEAPFPLSHMTAGMVAAYMNQIGALSEQRGLDLGDVRLVLHNYYSMEGSALKGTMVGGALPPELELEVGGGIDASAVEGLVREAVASAPVHALLSRALHSRFTLTVNGRQRRPGRAGELDGEPLPDPRDVFEAITVADVDTAQPLIELLVPAEEVEGEGGIGSSYAESQSRTLHVRGVCTRRGDGCKEIELHLHRPVGSTFRFISDEPPALGGHGRAPDAASYIAAGIAFCFMTQFGRYARITKRELTAYRLVQDVHLSTGEPGDAPAERPSADPVETHVHLETPEDDGFARDALDMSERTCFLHALCRTELQTKIRVAAGASQ